MNKAPPFLTSLLDGLPLWAGPLVAIAVLAALVWGYRRYEAGKFRRAARGHRNGP